MPKGTSRAKAMPNNEKIKPVALAVVTLHLPEGIISQSVENYIKRLKKKSVATC